MISNLCALQFVTANDYQANLDKLTSLIESSPKDSIILAPELCLSGYAYDDMLSASRFTQKAIKTIQSLSTDKTIVLTMITKSGDKFFNTA
ncbi:MAG: carbon-nitrogen hydrolase family protein, partial [Arcobacteraceae bacterium]|nr:carbon-nitrogen hydrolase family protein [Arcobacteraceae bacterium]